MLATLGRVEEAQTAVRELKAPFLPGAQLLIAAARGDWNAVQSLANVIDSTKASPALISILGRTGRAAALASRGSIGAAERELRTARDASSGSTARWYDRSMLLLAVAGGRAVAPNAAQLGDTTPAAAVGRALRAAIARDTVNALRELARVATAPLQQQTLLGHGPALVRAWIAAAGGRWNVVTGSLSATALAGEHDATVLDRVSSPAIRCWGQRLRAQASSIPPRSI